MNHYNVLIFPGGSEVGLEIHRALSGCKEVTLFSAGMDTPNHAPYVFRQHFIVPSIQEGNWLEELNRLLLEHKIDYIYPAYDDVIVALAKNADKLLAKLVLPPLQTCMLTRSKSATYLHFQSILPVPDMYSKSAESYKFPVFVKPDQGQGSEKTALVWSQQELVSVCANDPTAIVLEYLPGAEVTVDCFSDRERGLLFCGGRSRIRTKSGISMASAHVDDPIFEQYAQAILGELQIYGAWFFQLKKDFSGVYKLLEIAPRVAGSMALHRVRGVNFPLLSIYEHERLPISVMTNAGAVKIERALTNRYSHSYKFDVAYIDLDDTLILNGQVNINIIQFIYQCINKQVIVKLITRHVGDLSSTLSRYRLLGLFDEILHLTRGEEKAEFIAEANAVFIDDSFSERRKVFERRGIKTFDGSMIEVLFDART